jgi:hypothetical protein
MISGLSLAPRTAFSITRRSERRRVLITAISILRAIQQRQLYAGHVFSTLVRSRELIAALAASTP